MTEGVHPKDLSQQELDEVLREMRTVHAAGVLRCEEEEAENDADYIAKLEAVRDASRKVNGAAIALKKNKTTAAMHEVFKLIEKMSDALAAAKEPTKCPGGGLARE